MPQVRHHRAVGVRLGGQGDDGPDSDVDFLYVNDPDNVLGTEFFGLDEELQELLGRKVDLVPKHYLHWVIKDRVVAARPLYAA